MTAFGEESRFARRININQIAALSDDAIIITIDENIILDIICNDLGI